MNAQNFDTCLTNLNHIKWSEKSHKSTMLIKLKVV